MTTIETIIIGLIILILFLIALIYKCLKQYYDKVALELYDRITDLEKQINTKEQS